jgi:hypothetical protein
MASDDANPGSVVPFERSFFSSPDPITRIGSGELGGKAQGLVRVRDLLAAGRLPTEREVVLVRVPRMVILATGVFAEFCDRNPALRALAGADVSDDQLEQTFLAASMPAEVVGDLRALVEEVGVPLAVRSSSLLEDALHRPFAGVYGTKMVPNNQADPDTRFQRLIEAIKFVYASTWSEAARRYAQAAGVRIEDERMGVVIQEVVGERYDQRFYPAVSGVARSYDFFPSTGGRATDGVVNLALGLGKTIVDGGVCWIYSPARPKAPPPFASAQDRVRGTQLDFWAVNMGQPPVYDPMKETEYLVRADLSDAEYDGTMVWIASTYDPNRDRLVPGLSVAGPRVLDFAPLLVHGTLPLNALVRELLAAGEEALGEAVEIEFALTLPSRTSSRASLGVLQLRPMLVAEATVDLAKDGPDPAGVLLASDRVMGNGIVDDLMDIIYVRPQGFESRLTTRIALELGEFNRRLVKEDRPYLLMGFGRWGSSDPWLGIPVTWDQIAGARVIVESTLEGMNVDPSQGAHFFHNLIGFQVCYFCVRHDAGSPVFGRTIDWSWLDGQPAITESDHVRYVRLSEPLRVAVDGRSGRGIIWHSPPDPLDSAPSRTLP